MITVQALQCPNCKDVIYSRAHHDFHHCSCGDCFVDGGFDYMRAGWTDKSPEYLSVDVEASLDELYNDWNKQIDKFGIIKGGQIE
jgi:hypothetical protein